MARMLPMKEHQLVLQMCRYPPDLTSNMVLREQFGGHHLAINSSAEILSYDVEKDGLARPFFILGNS
jgi:hypothetical protein